jgi:hypothetical protein
MLSKDSLLRAFQRCHRGIGLVFSDLVNGWDGDIENLITDEKRLSGEQARSMSRRFEELSVVEDPNMAFSQMLDPLDIQKCARALSNKIGASPFGRGPFRLAFETSFLDSLVYFVAEDGQKFGDFVEKCYRDLGLILGDASVSGDGPGPSPAVMRELAEVTSGTVDVKAVLGKMHKSFRERLVACGFAQTFSDGATVMRVV